MRKKLEELVEKVTRERCGNLKEERENSKTLFLCNGELVGSVVDMGEGTVAGTVYAQRAKDRVHKEFTKLAEDVFGDRLEEKGTKLSAGIERSFYYTYVRVKL